MSRNTREQIIEAFNELVQEKDLDKITVKDIVERSGISRKTFYCYFQDIYGLLETVAELRLNKYIGVKAGETSPKAYIKKLLLFFVMERNWILHVIYSSSHLIELLRIFLKKAEEGFARLLDETEVLGNMTKAEAETFVRVLTCAIVVTGIKTKMKTEEDVDRELQRILDLFSINLN